LRATAAVFEAIEESELDSADPLIRPSTGDKNVVSSPSPSLLSVGRGEGGLRLGEESPETRQILLALDHCVLGAVEHEELVSHVAQATGQSKETILVVFSHTHAAGLMGLERASLPGGDLIPGYLQSVAKRAAELVN